MEEKICKNCNNYILYYCKVKGTFKQISIGHCILDNRKNDLHIFARATNGKVTGTQYRKATKVLKILYSKWQKTSTIFLRYSKKKSYYNPRLCFIFLQHAEIISRHSLNSTPASFSGFFVLIASLIITAA